MQSNKPIIEKIEKEEVKIEPKREKVFGEKQVDLEDL